MKLERPNYFSDPDEQEILLFGEEGQYRRISLDFWKDVYPNILQAYLANNQPDKDFKDIFVDPSFYPIGPDQALRLCVRVFNSVFSACFETDFEECVENQTFTEKDIETLKDKDGLLGALARVRNKVGRFGVYYFFGLLEIVNHFDGKAVKLTDKLPQTLYPQFLKEIRAAFYKFADLTGSEEIKEEINKIVFFPNPNAPQKIKHPRGYRIEPTEHARCVVVFENLEFGKKEQELFWDVMSFPGAFITMETVFFINCKFSANYNSPYEQVRSRVLFRNCLFEKDLAPSQYLRQSWRFINCTVKGHFDFRKTSFCRGFFIQGCIFETTSKLSLDNSKVLTSRTTKDVHYNKFWFKDTIFGGIFSLRKADFYNATMVFHNVAFFQSFYFDETNIGSDNTFERISFALGNSPQMNLCKKVFAELLLSRGYEIEAKSLGLVESEGKRRVLLSTRFSAWISTKDAMNIIGRSESWMKKKRQADRKKRTKTSIPFIGSGKGLLYPKSALQAYRIQDWNTLSELCDKYGIGTQDKNIAKEEKIETMRNRQMEFRKKPLF